MSTKISETFSKGMEHLKTGQDKVVEYVPPGLLKWSIFVLNFYFAAYSGYLLLFTRKTLIIGWKIHSGTPKYFSFFFLLLLSALMFVSFVIAIYAIFRKPSFIRAVSTSLVSNQLTECCSYKGVRNVLILIPFI